MKDHPFDPFTGNWEPSPQGLKESFGHFHDGTRQVYRDIFHDRLPNNWHGDSGSSDRQQHRCGFFGVGTLFEHK